MILKLDNDKYKITWGTKIHYVLRGTIYTDIVTRLKAYEMNQLHPAFSISGCCKDSHVFISALETLQFSTVWFSTVPHPTISESLKYSCSDYS